MIRKVERIALPRPDFWLLAFLLLGSVAIAGVLLEQYLIAGVVLAVVVLALSAILPREALIVLIIWTFLQNLPGIYLTQALQNADLLDEVILVGLTLRWVLPMLVHQKRFRRTPLDIPFLLFILYFAFSAMINDVPPLNAIFAFRDVFQYLLLFYALVNIDFKPDILIKSVNIFYWIALANFVALMAEVAVFFARTHVLFIEDQGVGLMGSHGAHKLGYFAGMLLMLYIVRFLMGLKVRWYWFAILSIIIVFTSARAVYFWVPLSLVIVFFRWIIKRPRWLVRTAVAIAAFAGLVLIYVSLPITHSATINLLTLYRQQQGTSDAGTLRRVGFLDYSWQTLMEHNPIIGTGPGSYVSKTPVRLGSALYTKFKEDFPFENSFNTGSQLSLMLVEYGFAGSALILFIYWRIYQMGLTIGKNATNPLDRYLAYGAQAMTVMIMISMVSIDIFELQEVVFIPWFLYGVIWVRQLKHAANNEQILSGGEITR